MTNPRSDLLRKNGQLRLGIAVVLAVICAVVASAAGGALLGAALAAWLALGGHRLVVNSAPLSPDERKELERLRGGSRVVRQLLEALRAGGAEPVRLDLLHCRRLARLETMAGRG